MQNVVIPLLKMLDMGECTICLDTGIWLNYGGAVAVCPRVQLGERHAEPNEAALILRRECNRLFFQKTPIMADHFRLAQILTRYTSAEPCRGELLTNYFFAGQNHTHDWELRRLAQYIEALRNVWLLPVGSSKSKPSGYYLCRNEAEYREWFKRAGNAPITQFSTLRRNAKHCFPVFAEQIELEFWEDMGPHAA